MGVSFTQTKNQDNDEKKTAREIPNVSTAGTKTTGRRRFLTWKKINVDNYILTWVLIKTIK